MKLATLATTVSLSFCSVFALAQDDSQKYGMIDRYGVVTPSHVLSITTGMNTALLDVQAVRRSPDSEQIKALKQTVFTGKKPQDVFVRTQRLGDLIDLELTRVGLAPVPRIPVEGESAVPAEVYLSIGHCFDGVVRILAHESPDKPLGAHYTVTNFQNKTPSDVLSAVDHAVRRLELALDQTPEAGAIDPQSHATPDAPAQHPAGTEPETAQQADAPPVTAFLPRPATGISLAMLPATPVFVVDPVMDPSMDAATEPFANQPAQDSVTTNEGGSPPPDTVTPAPSTFVRPKRRPVTRYEEDWSRLRSTDQSGDFWDPVKYIPLSDDGDTYLSIGGSVRTRYELWDNFAFGAPANDNDSFLVTRFRLHGDLHFGDAVRVFVEGKSALSTNRDLPGGIRGIDANSLALQNAFVDLVFPVGDATITLRPGRQGMQFGKQRLVSPLPWANNLRTFEGMRGIVEVGEWRIDGFGTRLVNTQKYEFDDGDSGSDLYGVYAAGKFPNTSFDLDLYWLYLDKTTATFAGVTGTEERHTIGARVGGKIADTGFDFDVESAYQFGDHATTDISAFMVASQLGYRFADVSGKPRVYVGLDYASGDDDPTDGDLNTFNQLFPLGHAYHGFIDIVGRQNAVDLSIGAMVSPVDRLTLRADAHFMWLADDADALYNAGGGVVRPGGVASSTEIGTELDFTAKYGLDAHSAVQVGYSILFPGNAIEDSGRSDDIHFAYFQFMYSF